ncbi:hypothetical protein GGR52DRAFT_526260 [Hypoxylon sp. FL1284]|nr:hypothetical protein GGR52DRAFT_526260 [Hypoxylon sp. FL1284]
MRPTTAPVNLLSANTTRTLWFSLGQANSLPLLLRRRCCLTSLQCLLSSEIFFFFAVTNKKGVRLAKNQIAHHPIRGHWPFRCTECGTVIWRSAELMREHARHNRFKCSCGKTFSRSDALTRHCRQGQKSFHCPKRRCNGAFSRNDHLIQHLRTYHALDEKEIKEIYPNFGGNENVVELACPYVGCEFSRYSQLRFTPWLVELTAPFTKRSDYSRHLKLVHNESPFPCLVNGCERNGGKGYMRKKDLMKHVAKQHPNAPSSSPTALQETS